MELHFSDIVRPAPVVRRPFENLYSPYPIGCSKLCNHPIDKDLKREYKEVIRKTKENLVRKLGRILDIFKTIMPMRFASSTVKTPVQNRQKIIAQRMKKLPP